MKLETLDDFIVFAGQAVPYTVDNYPILVAYQDGKHKEDAFAFKLTHSLRHMSKTAGRINALLERFDHGDVTAMDREKLKELVTEGLFNSLRLAELAGITAAEAEGFFRKKFKSCT